MINCAACPLGRTTRCVGPEGPRGCRLFVIGRNPGADEDRIGRPFVGASGKILDFLLNHAGLSRGEVYITNLVKAFTEANREPTAKEIYACTEKWLLPELRVGKPLVVVALGLTVIKYFSDFKTVEAARTRKIFKPVEHEFFVIPTYHPSWILRNGLKAEHVQAVADDFVRAKHALIVLKRSTEERP